MGYRNIDYKPGQEVQLISGGPKMYVIGRQNLFVPSDDLTRPNIVCTWYHGPKKMLAEFTQDEIKPYGQRSRLP